MHPDIRRRRRRSAAKEALKYAVLIMVALVVVFPIYWMVITGLKTRLELFAERPTFWPQEISWTQYRSAFGDRPFLRFMLNSAVVATSASLLAVVVGSLAAYSLSRFRFPRNLDHHLAFWILSTRMVPPIVTVIPLFLVIRQLGLLNTYLGLGMVYLAFNLPFVVWMMKGFFREIPAELEEAAMVDGCSRMAALRRVVLPLAAPGFAATIIFCLILTWNEFIFALVLTSTSASMTLPVGISGLISQYELMWGEMAAAGTAAIIPIVFAALFIQRHLIRGLTFGAVKG